MSFHQNWKLFLESKNVLQEISSEVAEDLMSWFEDNDGVNSLSFDHLFKGDNLRAVVKLPSPVEASTDLQQMLNWAGNVSYKVDLGSGTIARNYKDRDGNKREQKFKLGKFLNRLVKMSQSIYDFEFKKDKASDYELILGGAPGYHTEDYSDEEKDKMESDLKKIDSYLKKNTKQHEKNIQNFNDLVGQTSFFMWPLNELRVSKYASEQLIKWLEFWNKNSEFYRRNPDQDVEVEDKLAIIVSRHPIDVVRMSDFNRTGIHSCHSEGAQYFHCAVSEAHGYGLVAFVVETKDLKGIDEHDLYHGELFQDSYRRVGGIDPHARIRLRRYYNEANDYEIAGVERAIYGIRFPGFLETLNKWATNQQAEYLQNRDGEWKFNKDASGDYEVANTPDPRNFMSELVLTGGSYADNSAGYILSSTFGLEGHFQGSVEHQTNDFEENRLAQVEEEVNRLQAYADNNLRYVSVHSDIDDYDVDRVYVSFGASMGVEVRVELQKLSDGMLEGGSSHTFNNYQNEYSNEVAEIFVQAANELMRYDYDISSYDFESTYWEDSGGKAVFNFSFGIDNADNTDDPDGLESFIDWLERDIDPHGESLKNIFHHSLIAAGVLKSTEYTRLLDRYDEEDLNFNYINFDYEEGDQRIEILSDEHEVAWIPVNRAQDSEQVISSTIRAIQQLQDMTQNLKSHIEDELEKLAVQSSKILQRDLFKTDQEIEDEMNKKVINAGQARFPESVNVFFKDKYEEQAGRLGYSIKWFFRAYYDIKNKDEDIVHALAFMGFIDRNWEQVQKKVSGIVDMFLNDTDVNETLASTEVTILKEIETALNNKSISDIIEEVELLLDA